MSAEEQQDFWAGAPRAFIKKDTIEEIKTALADGRLTSTGAMILTCIHDRLPYLKEGVRVTAKLYRANNLGFNTDRSQPAPDGNSFLVTISSEDRKSWDALMFGLTAGAYSTGSITSAKLTLPFALDGTEQTAVVRIKYPKTQAGNINRMPAMLEGNTVVMTIVPNVYVFGDKAGIYFTALTHDIVPTYTPTSYEATRFDTAVLPTPTN